MGQVGRNLSVGPRMSHVAGLLKHSLSSSNAGYLPQYHLSLAETVMI